MYLEIFFLSGEGEGHWKLEMGFRWMLNDVSMTTLEGLEPQITVRTRRAKKRFINDPDIPFLGKSPMCPAECCVSL